MADQVRRAIAWVYNNAKSFGGDPNRIHVSGQSSGAHLSGCVVTTDWKDYGVPNDIVKGALLCSGMYDLSRCGCRSARTMSPSPTRARRSCRRSAGSTG